MERAPLEIRRHVRALSPKETGEVVEIVAGLFVNYLKGRRERATPADGGEERTRERKPEQAPER